MEKHIISLDRMILWCPPFLFLVVSASRCNTAPACAALILIIESLHMYLAGTLKHGCRQPHSAALIPLCNPIISSNTLQQSPRAVADRQRLGSSTRPSKTSYKPRHIKHQTSIDQSVGRLAAMQADCMQQDRADSHSLKKMI